MLTPEEREAAAQRAEEYPPGHARYYVACADSQRLRLEYPSDASTYLLAHPEAQPHG